MDAQHDVARAQQQRVDRLLGDRGNALGPRRELAAQDLARQRRRRGGERSRHLLLQRVELLADRARTSAPTCVVVWLAKLCLKPSSATSPSR